MAKNKVHTSWEAPGSHLCVDLFQRPDGSWGFEEYRREPEDGRGWYPVGFHAQRRFPSAEETTRAACSAVPWLPSVVSG